MACTAFSNPISGNVCYSLKHFQNCVKQESVYFVICPKQGPSLEGVVLHSYTPLPKHESSTLLPSPPPPIPSPNSPGLSKLSNMEKTSFEPCGMMLNNSKQCPLILNVVEQAEFAIKNSCNKVIGWC